MSEFIHTRGVESGFKNSVSFSEAILNPSAGYGGLYTPKQIPDFSDNFAQQHKNDNYKELSLAVLKKFNIDIDDHILEEALSLYDHFDDPNNPVPLAQIEENLYISELYHGPTRAFKDMALQPFGVILSHLAKKESQDYLILAATSGDTGPATLETFANKPNIEVICLYPDGGTSGVQRLQMVCEDAKNLTVIGIKGNFDDAQNALKFLLANSEFKELLKTKNKKLSAANSVNFGRIIFQIIYHIYSYIYLLKNKKISISDSINLIVPSGNFGNALGALYAKKGGIKIDKIYIASNSNNILSDFINTGEYDLRGRELLKTSSPAMDILISSNVERVLFILFGAERTRELMRDLVEKRYYKLTTIELSVLQEHFSADFCDDDFCDATIKKYVGKGYLMDPHTATAIKLYEKNSDNKKIFIAYSTAEWTKFSPTVCRAIFESGCENDKEALELISKNLNKPIHKNISSLFDKEIKQKLVVEKDDLVEAIKHQLI